MIDKMNSALEFLRGKYGIPAGTVALNGKMWQLERPGAESAVLLPQRMERRFVELKKIIDSNTVEDISTYRFAHFTASRELEDIMAVELDLVQFLSGSVITQVFASAAGGRACNIIFRLANGQSGCIECGTALPEGSEDIDRHEIIARRGVASDRVVDTQVPQSSIYEWSSSGYRTFTDIDTELYGLPNEHIHVVRAAYFLLANPEMIPVWNAQAAALQKQTAAVADSVRSGAVVRL